LKGLDLVAGELARVMGGVTAGLQTVLGARTTQGLMGMSGASINLMSSGIEAMLSADPTGISRAAAGAAAFAVGAGGQIITNELAATGSVAGLTGADGSTLTKKEGSGENDKPGAFDSLSKGFTLGGSTKMEVGQPLEGKMSVSGYKFHEKESDGKKHTGIDYSATHETKVYAVADGEISDFKVGMRDSQVKNGKAVYTAGQGNGNFVCIDHGVGKNKLRIYSYYKHLSSVEAKFQKKGAPVKKGDFLGYAGSTGDSTGTHLHYQVNEGGTEVDPSKLSSLLGNSKGTSYSLDSAQMSQATALTSAIQSLYSGDYAGALGSLGSLLGISDLASKYGISGSSSTPANKYANAGNTATGSGGASGSVTNNVGGITVNIKDATPESAKKFAEYVQEYLNNQTLTSNLGSL
jgi:murein DD-endopeptidase MepM/ murein hydrolase activator NlpD